jgi:hypothetical protein
MSMTNLKNPYKKPFILRRDRKSEMTRLWMRTCFQFLPYTEYDKDIKLRKGEIGRMFGCRIIFEDD